MAFAQFNKTLAGSRKGSGSYVGGVWVPGSAAQITIAASVQPASENELKLLPEGRREDGAYALRSKQEIRAEDVFPIYGDDHEVLRVQVWQNGVIPHYLGLAVRVQP